MGIPGGLVVKDLALSLLWIGFRSLAQEFPHALDIAEKKKEEKKENGTFERVLNNYGRM